MGDILGVSHTLNPPYVHETGIGEPADASSQMSESGNNDNEETGRGLTDLDLDGGIDGLDSDPSTPLEEEFDIALGTFEAHVSQASAKFDSQRSQPPVTITAEDESASQPTANPPLSTPKGIDQHVKNRRRSSEKRVKTEEDTRPGKRGRLAGQTDAQAAPYKDAMESLNDKISSQRYDDIALLFKHEADMKAQERKERDERDAKEKKEREERDAKEKKEREERDARDREEREQRDERLFAMFGALIAKSNN